MHDILYKRDSFVIIKGYVVINTETKGHTHLHNYNASKKAIDLVINKKIPRDCSKYYLESLERIASDEVYRRKVRELIETRQSKGVYRKNKTISIGGKRNG